MKTFLSAVTFFLLLAWNILLTSRISNTQRVVATQTGVLNELANAVLDLSNNQKQILETSISTVRIIGDQYGIESGR